MTYADYINRLLAPLGVYALDESTVSGALVQALGAELDELWEQMQLTLKNAFPQTALAEALPIWEHLLPSAGVKDADRLAAVCAVATKAHAECTSEHLNALLMDVGLSATVSISQGTVTISGTDVDRAIVFLMPFLPAQIRFPLEEDESE